MPVRYGSSVTMNSRIVYSRMCSCVNSTPYATGSIGMPAFA